MPTFKAGIKISSSLVHADIITLHYSISEGRGLRNINCCCGNTRLPHSITSVCCLLYALRLWDCLYQIYIESAPQVSQCSIPGAPLMVYTINFAFVWRLMYPNNCEKCLIKTSFYRMIKLSLCDWWVKPCLNADFRIAYHNIFIIVNQLIFVNPSDWHDAGSQTDWFFIDFIIICYTKAHTSSQSFVRKLTCLGANHWILPFME